MDYALKMSGGMVLILIAFTRELLWPRKNKREGRISEHFDVNNICKFISQTNEDEDGIR
jgi:hypothetical protein